MKVYKKAILPLSFMAAGVSCGIKRSGKLDLALFYSGIPAKASCMFTSNSIQAAPVKLSKAHLRAAKSFQAVLVNSGNANCFRGRQGLKDAQDSLKAAAEALGLRASSVLVNSTGIIGRRLDVSKIKKALPVLANGLSRSGIGKAARAIMTTDRFTKEATAQIKIGSRIVTICGLAKGAGMIAPDMATMLAFIFTDAEIGRVALNQALRRAVDFSFNCITVDGCMSTNDSVMMLANGAACNKTIKAGSQLALFQKALSLVCLRLAMMIVQDAEGATKFIRIRVQGARSIAEAKKAALSVANSNLFKTAFYGQNPNFGRIAAAVGSSGIAATEEKLKIRVTPLKKRDIDVGIKLGQGNSGATVYTSDLTPEYVKINAQYN